MKTILHIATMDQGGAWTATYRLHHLMLKNYNSKILVKSKSLYDQNIIPYRKNFFDKAIDYLFFKWRNIIKRNEKTFDKNYYFHNLSEKVPNYNLTKFILETNLKPDLIILHWVSGFVNTKTIQRLQKELNCEIAWYALDMSPLTGGCHYAWDCRKYQTHCGECPALLSSKKKDIAYRNFETKQKFISRTNLTVVSSTPWVTNQLKESALFNGKKIEEILLSVNPNIFSPIDKNIARTILKIPIDKKVILTGSSSVNDIRKGVKYFMEAISVFYQSLSKSQQEDYYVLISGDYHEVYNQLPFPHKCTGFLKDEISLALTYQAADVYVCSSIEDTGPMMINESIQCGTPVVAFEMGVAIKLVVNGLTGYCARNRDSDDLANGLKIIMSLRENEKIKMANDCQKLGLELLSPEMQLKKFEALLN